MFNNYGQSQSYPGVSSYTQIAGQFGQQQPNPYGQRFPQQQPVFSQQTNITFVNGIEGAKAFQLSPNSNALLMDSDNSKFYVKSTDNLGVAKIASYTFSEDENLQGLSAGANNSAEAGQQSNESYDALLSKLTELEQRTNELSAKIAELF